MDNVTPGKVVSIITSFLLVTSTLAVAARLSTKRAVSGKTNVDDGLAVMALLCHIGSGIAVCVLDANGLGSALRGIDVEQRTRFAKSAFAANLLFIATLCFAKLSIILFLNLITRQPRHRLLGNSLGAFIILWSIVEFVAAAFTCKTPATWDIFGSRCFDRVTFWYIFGAVNIVTDFALIALPSYIVLPLQMRAARKWMVISCFSTRFLDIMATGTQFAYTANLQDSDFSLRMWPWVLISQIVLCLSIVTSCVPYLRPLMESLPSGMFMSDEIRRRGEPLISRDRYVKTSDENHVLRSRIIPA
ncbi:MAG: hypothetical protein Q9207_006670 [Kuettlingeria erythrocarpa]